MVFKRGSIIWPIKFIECLDYINVDVLLLINMLFLLLILLLKKRNGIGSLPPVYNPAQS